MSPSEIILYIVILLFSVILHEVSHGWVAEKLGDPTARLAGRLTLNPIPHIDPFGSILLPAVMYWATGGAFGFGAAKPVPVNYQNLRNFKRDIVLVAFAGPITNFLIAAIAALLFRFIPAMNPQAQTLLMHVILLNLVLAVFNMIPIPPLDGSKILASIFGFFSRTLMYWYLELERYGFILVLLLLFTGIYTSILIPSISFLLKLLLGPGASL